MYRDLTIRAAASNFNLRLTNRRAGLRQLANRGLRAVTQYQRSQGVEARSTRSSIMTLADFYRAEAARCRARAEKASTPEREMKWRRRAEDSVRFATELEAAEAHYVS